MPFLYWSWIQHQGADQGSVGKQQSLPVGFAPVWSFFVLFLFSEYYQITEKELLKKEKKKNWFYVILKISKNLQFILIIFF